MMSSAMCLKRLHQLSFHSLISYRKFPISSFLTLKVHRDILTSCKLNLSLGNALLSTTEKGNHASAEEQDFQPGSTELPPEQNGIEKEYIKKIALLSQDVEEYKDKYQRTLADRENLRQRLEKQIVDSKLFGIQSFCKDLLEVSDVFRKAIESVPEEKVKGADPILEGLYNGVVMTEQQLLSVFRRHGLERIIPKEGDKFDPSIQEAMFEVPLEEGQEPGTVAHIVRTGWKLRDRCVRSAQVGVVKG